jgi:tetratricopeptide (TPR) repeat protein
MGQRMPDDVDPTLAVSPATSPEAAQSEEMPEVLRDRYVLGEVLGRGGLGVVLSAWDPELERRVAIKLIRSGRSGIRDRTRATERMFLEAQALARLSHPNVVPVFDVGTYDLEHGERGVFVAMEQLPGPALVDWLRTTRTVEEILRVFALAGEGLAAAHDAGLVHRDFKPGNVVLDGSGRAKVVDFGLALGHRDPRTSHASADSVADTRASSSVLAPRVTELGLVMGTPRYMAPEQHADEPVGPATDQYAFCVALWEALRGGPVFGGETIEILAEAKRAQSFAPPSAGDRTPPRLVSVLRRGLDPDPNARWPSMRALLDAIADSTADARRSRAWLAGLGVIGVLGVAWTFVPSERCAPPPGAWTGKTQGALRERYAGSPDALASIEDRAKQQAARLSTRFVAACEAHREGNIDAAALDRRVACLRAASSELEATLQILVDPEAPHPDAALEVIAGLQPLDPCDDDARLAQTLPPPSDPKLEAVVARLRGEMARVEALSRAGREDDAAAALARAETEAQALGYAPLLVELRLHHAHRDTVAGRFAEAEVALERLLVEAEEIGHDTIAAQAAAALVFVIGIGQSRHEEALERAEAARALLHRAGDPTRTAARLHGALGSIYNEQHRFDEAIAEHEAALALLAAGPEPDRAEMTIALSNLGVALQMKGDLEAAAAKQREALAIREELLGPEHPRVAQSALNLANTLAKQGSYEDAEVLYRRSIAILERAEVPGPRLSYPLMGLGVVYKKQGRYDEAAPLYERAAELAEAAYGPEHSLVAQSLRNLANLEKRRGNPARARELVGRAVRAIEARLGDAHPELGSALVDLGDIERALGDTEAARRAYARAIEIYDAAAHPEAGLANALVGLGNVALSAGELEDARVRFERARELYRELGDTDVAYAELGLGEVALANGDREGAEPLLRAAAEAFSDRPDSATTAREARDALARATR